MSIARRDTIGIMRLLIRYGDGPWLDALTGEQVSYSLAQAMWRRDKDGVPRQLVDLHAAFVSEGISIALVTDRTGDQCDFARSHHTCCTRMVNTIRGRARGTIWDNRGLLTREVVGWEGVLHAIGQIAALAALASGTNDPYQCDTFYGPRHWGQSVTCVRPPEVVSDRSVMPLEATLALIEPAVRPANLSRNQLIHEAEAAIDAGIARCLAQLEHPPRLRNIRPFHARRHLDGELPEFSDDLRFIGPVDLVKAAAEEADAWDRYYTRCRGEFPERPDVVFPAGTIRFRRLGAACDPCKPYRPAPCPPRSKPVHGPPPPVYPAPRAQADLSGRPPPT